MLNQTVQNPLDGIGEVNAMGSGRASTLEYIPYSTKHKYIQTPTKTKKSFPIYPETRERSQLNSYRGTKRAFLKSHEQSAKFAQQLLDKNWAQQEKIRAWNFKQQTKAIETNIRCRDQSVLGDYHHKKLKIYGVYHPTTGPRPVIKLPPDRQVTEYNPTHIHYF